MTEPTDAVPMTGGDACVRVYAAEAVITMPPDSTLLAVADELAGDQIGLVVLGSMDSVEGVISERDVVRGVADARDPDGHAGPGPGQHEGGVVRRIRERP